MRQGLTRPVWPPYLTVSEWGVAKRYGSGFWYRHPRFESWRPSHAICRLPNVERLGAQTPTFRAFPNV